MGCKGSIIKVRDIVVHIPKEEERIRTRNLFNWESELDNEMGRGWDRDSETDAPESQFDFGCTLYKVVKRVIPSRVVVELLSTTGISEMELLCLNQAQINGFVQQQDEAGARENMFFLFYRSGFLIEFIEFPYTWSRKLRICFRSLDFNKNWLCVKDWIFVIPKFTKKD